MSEAFVAYVRFEEKLLFSNRFNQKEVIKLIEEEIDRIK